MIKRRVHVAAAAVVHPDGRVLIAKRPATADQGGLWEFPGGKLAPYETGLEALRRELQEELGILITKAQPLIRIHHEYPDKHILLDVWQVREYEGELYGREGQPVRWVDVEDLPKYQFPAANLPILRAVALPQEYLITAEESDDEQFLARLERALKEDHIRLVQLRAKTLDDAQFQTRAEKTLALCRQYKAKLLLNADPAWLKKIDADGIHLTSVRLMDLTSRPIPKHKWLGASTHNAEQLSQAGLIDCDFSTLSPLAPTPSHPDAITIGWHDFQEMVEVAAMPVFALGGMTRHHANQARGVGAQGIASIRDFWQSKD